MIMIITKISRKMIRLCNTKNQVFKTIKEIKTKYCKILTCHSRKKMEIKTMI